MATKKTNLLSDIMAKEVERGPQIAHPKEIGYVITKVGLNRRMRVLDAGAGSGYFAIYLATAAKEVVTYEIDKRWQKLAKKNFAAVKKVGIRNIRLISGDVKKTRERGFDLVTFDFKESWKGAAISAAKRALNKDGWLVLYYPTIDQVKLAARELKRQKFKIVDAVELIERKWQLEPGTRPQSRQLGHTAFLVFARRV